MNPFVFFTKPEYLFWPSRIPIRLMRSFGRAPGETEEVRLAWGAPLRVHPREVIGAVIWYYGIFDVIVTEVIARLLDPSETAVDVGANIGQMTSLMSRLVRDSGEVHAYEPHPELFEELVANADLSAAMPGYARPVLHQEALSNRSGAARLATGDAWQGNRGIAKVVSEHGGGGLSIQLSKLDEAFAGRRIDLCKIDVEGHEHDVLSGASALLSEHRIRDIVFEDFEAVPSRTCLLLQSHGYTLFKLQQHIHRPRLVPLTPGIEVSHAPEDSNFLATIAPQRAIERFRPTGWRIFRL